MWLSTHAKLKDQILNLHKRNTNLEEEDVIGAKQEEEKVLKNNDDELKIGCFKRLQHDRA